MEELKEYLKRWYYVDNETGCWLWRTLKDNINSRPFLVIKGKTRVASRIFYSVYNGKFPQHLFVCHKCDIPGCVNPDHLFLGTSKDNMMDKVKKGRCGDVGAKRFRFTQKQAESIRDAYKRVGDYTKIAKKLKVSPNTIRAVVLNLKYGE